MNSLKNSKLSWMIGFLSLVVFSSVASAAENLMDYETEASEQTVVHVTSDAMDGYTDIKVVLDADYNLLGLRYYTDQHEVVAISLAQLAHGMVLIRKDNHDVVKLEAPRMTVNAGGAVRMSYLESGISNKYGEFNMTLVRNGEKWSLLAEDSNERRRFTNMYLKARKLFGKVIGIKEVIVR